MPNFNQYAATVPNIRPEIPKTGINQIVKPVFDYVNTFPPSTDFGDAGTSSPIDALNKGEANPFSHLGLTPIAPAVATDYNTAKRYDDSSLMFLPTRDNEDLYAKDQGFFRSVGDGLGRLVLTAGTKLGTGIGYTAGLAGMGNSHEDGSGFGGWISGAADNGLAKWFETAENEKVKEDWLPIYQEAKDRDKGFFRRAATDLNFWTEDVTDGAAFMAGAFVPGMAISKLGAGTEIVSALAKTRGLTNIGEAAALGADGLTGAVESELALSRGATVAGTDIGGGAAAIEGNSANLATKYAATTQSTEAGFQQLPRALSWIDNAKLARNIDVGATTFINTASEAMFEAKGVKDDLINKLSQVKNEDGSYKYNAQEVRTLAAKGAKDTFVMNLGALSASNLWEANLFFKKLPGAARAVSAEGKAVSGLLDDVTMQKRTFGQRLFETSKTIGEGVVAEGLWEENIQLAIQRLNESDENFDLSFGGKLIALGKQYAKQTAAAITGDDPEAASNIGIGGLMGGAANVVLGVNGAKAEAAKVDNLNKQVNFFKTLGNIYVQGTDGKLALDNAGNPTVDVNKLKAYAASMNKVLGLQEVGNNLENRSVNELAQVFKDEVFARFAKAHFDNGLGDLLHERLDTIGNITQEDMMMLGYDPLSKNASIPAAVDAYKKKAQDLETLYDNIQKNYLPARRDKKGKKFFEVTDKLFYMSARAQSLTNQITDTKTQYDALKADTATFDSDFNRESDSVVDGYNEKFEKVKAFERNAEVRDNYLNTLNAQSTTTTRNGVTVTTPEGRLNSIRRNNPSVAVQLPTSYIESGREELEAAQKDLNDYIDSNKEALEKMSKDARGRYQYEVRNKSVLPSSKELQRLQIVQAEFLLGYHNTREQIGRLADIDNGYKYYDQVYAPALQREKDRADAATPEVDTEDSVTDQDVNLAPTPVQAAPALLDEDEVDEEYDAAVNEGKVNDKDAVVDHIVTKVAKGEKLTEKEEVLRQVVKDDVETELRKKKESTVLGEDYEKKDQLNAEKDALEAVDNRTEEQEDRLDTIYRQLDALDDTIGDKFTILSNEITVASADNIKPEDKETFNDILNAISKNKKRVVKFPTYYEVDGVRYEKVTDVIGDTINAADRADVQNAINAGYTIDSIVKAFFAGEVNDTFRNSMADKISEEAYDRTIAKLRKIETNLRDKGINIVANNVVIFDEQHKVAGEIDLLGVDKDGNFKIYEVEARQPYVYKNYAKVGRTGVSVREINQKRLTTYRNIFANQYGAVPNEVSVMFPFSVSYDKNSPSGYINNAKVNEEIRFPVTAAVDIKRRVFEPIRPGSKFDVLDLMKIYSSTFLPSEELKAKVRFLMRNVSLKEIQKKLTLSVKEAEQRFQDTFKQQSEVLNGLPTDYKIRKFGNFPNLYSLVGNKELAVKYEGDLVGYMSPAKTLAYKDAAGQFHILDENTSPEDYSRATGNSLETHQDFVRIAKAYSFAYNRITDRLKASPEGVNLSNAELNDFYDTTMSYGELDKIPVGGERPLLKDLDFSGVRVGNKQIVTVAHIDANEGVQVMMDKTKKTPKAIAKLQNVDKWVNNNLEETILPAMTNRGGKRTTEHIAIVELPSGEYKVIPLKLNSGSKIQNNEEFVDGLGSEFTAATTKQVFKGEGLAMVPKFSEELLTFGLNDKTILNKVYPAEEANDLEAKSPLKPSAVSSAVNEELITNFGLTLDPDEVNNLYALYSAKDASAVVSAIMDDYNNSIGFDSLEKYLEHIKNCKL